MNPNDHDPCDDLLAPPPVLSDLTPLREQILRRTTRRLRIRRYLRRVAFAAALAACWAGGMLTMRWLSPMPPPAPPIVQIQPAPVEPQPEAPRPTPPALALEWQAFDSDEKQAELYRTAAAAYLNEEHDPLSAVRCYGQALDAAPEQTQTISTDDDWLLMAIKDARKKEKNHAKTLD